jgi:hypothetical protein
MVFSNLFLIVSTFGLVGRGLIAEGRVATLCNGLARGQLQALGGCVLRTLTFWATSCSARLSDRSIFGKVSSEMCLVNAFSPPDFRADQVSDCDSNGLRSVGVKTLVDQLV